MTTARFKDHFSKGLLSARPGAGTLPAGAKYAASDTGLIYETDGVSTWSTWFNPGPGTDPEIIRDIIGAALVAGSGITITVNDAGDTITVASSGGGGGGGVLGVCAYNPGTLATYSTSSSTPSDVDATNLAVTFTAPASGSVLVTLSALCNAPGASPSNALNWHLRNGSTTVASRWVIGAASIDNMPGAVQLLVTGLTPGAPYTYKWGHSRSGSGSATATYAGGAAGAAVMAVLSA